MSGFYARRGDWRYQVTLNCPAHGLLHIPAVAVVFFLHYSYLFIILEQMKNGSHLSDFELISMLVLLRLGDGAYGVPIAREIEEQTKRQVKLGSVYATLERLEEKGFVVSELGESTPERGGRAKRYFRVTKQGMREVRETRQILIRLWQGVPELRGGRL
jgi:PadR family transcriptional regulator, regulatory protein PadR